jgi:hypothetical protein
LPAESVEPAFHIEWYRPAMLGRLLIIWAVAICLMSTGVLASAVALDNTGRIPLVWQRIAGVIGGFGTLSGALVGLLGVLRLLSQDPVCLLLRRDGVSLRVEQDETFIAWEALSGCKGAGRVLILERDGAAPVITRQRFMGVTAELLAARILAVQRMALLGVLDMRQRHKLPVSGVRSEP